jgi:exodeoxyribonuclease VII small subunit
VPKEKEVPFEALYARLEEKVGRLEQGGLSLDEAIAVYEEGMTLARRCQEQLDAAELKITKLKESFAPVAAREATQAFGEAPDDYEYVADDEPPEDEPFA